MAEFTQEPQNQAPAAFTIPSQSPGTTGGAGTISPSAQPLVSFVGDGAGVLLLQATIPAMVFGLYLVTSATVTPLRDAYLGGENCPPVLEYPMWGQRGLRWISRTNPY